MLTLKVQTFVTMCYDYTNAFSTQFWAWWTEPLRDSFLNLLIRLQSVTTKMLLQRLKKMKVTRYQYLTRPDRWQPCRSNVDRSVSNIHFIVPTWHHINFIYSVLWRSIFPVIDSKCCSSARSCLTVVPFTKSRILHWGHTFTDNTW